jgi:LysM repeat protein
MNMISRPRLFLNLVLVLLASFILAGCVRPVPEPEGAASAEPDMADPNVGGGTANDPTPAPITTVPETSSAATLESPPPAEASTAVPAETDAAPQEAAPEIVEVTATPAEAPAAAPATPAPTPETAAAQPAAGETAVTTAACPTEHVVQPGENLYRIGLQYGLSWVALAQYNGITNPNNITAGQTLKIPCPGTTPPTQPTATPDILTYYTVQPGDNLYRIGLKFGVSWVEIAEANGLVNPNAIYAGQVLKIPASAPGPRPEFTHIVKQGETIYSISVQYGVSAAAVAEANNLQSPYVIFAGQTLIIPGNG